MLYIVHFCYLKNQRDIVNKYICVPRDSAAVDKMKFLSLVLTKITKSLDFTTDKQFSCLADSPKRSALAHIRLAEINNKHFIHFNTEKKWV